MPRVLPFVGPHQSSLLGVWWRWWVEPAFCSFVWVALERLKNISVRCENSKDRVRDDIMAHSSFIPSDLPFSAMLFCQLLALLASNSGFFDAPDDVRARTVGKLEVLQNDTGKMEFWLKVRTESTGVL